MLAPIKAKVKIFIGSFIIGKWSWTFNLKINPPRYGKRVSLTLPIRIAPVIPTRIAFNLFF